MDKNKPDIRISYSNPAQIWTEKRKIDLANQAKIDFETDSKEEKDQDKIKE